MTANFFSVDYLKTKVDCHSIQSISLLIDRTAKRIFLLTDHTAKVILKHFVIIPF